MQELLWLLLPVAAASGWYAAMKYRSASATKGQPPDCGPVYYTGLNHLLNEQPDKAIEVFTSMLEVDSETVETHLALGSLFRRRGEVDRAIRVHAGLLDRTSLSQEQRDQALLELGRDHLQAGLLDRAEGQFQLLVNSAPHRDTALRQLLSIYEQEREWAKAITAARELEAQSGESQSAVIAHYYCELAEKAKQSGDDQQQEILLGQALQEDSTCVRAVLARAECEWNSGELEATRRTLQRVERQDPAYLPEVIASVVDCYRSQGKLGEAQSWLEGILKRHPGIPPLLALADVTAAKEGEAQASALLAQHLQDAPSLRGLERLITLEMADLAPHFQSPFLVLRTLIGSLLEKRPTHRCEHCGFAGRMLHWQCPGCRKWNTIKPIQAPEDE